MRKKLRGPYARAGWALFLSVGGLMVLWHFLQSAGDIQLWVADVFSVLTRAFMPLILGVIIAYFLEPFANAIQRLLVRIMKKSTYKTRRAIAVAVTFVLLLVLIVLAIAWLVPELIDSITALVRDLPRYFRIASEFVTDMVENQDFLDKAQVYEFIDDQGVRIADWFKNSSAQLLTGVLSFFRSTGTTVLNIVLGLVVALYLMLDWHGFMSMMRKMLQAFMSQSKVDRMERLARDMDEIFGRYIGARLAESVILTMMSYVALVIIGLPYAPLLAIIVGFFNLVPYIGSFVSTLIVITVALFQSWTAVFAAGIALTLVQSLDNYVVTPRLFGDKMGISPVVVLVTVTAGGVLFGVWGMIFSVPAVGFIRVVLQRVRRNRMAAAFEAPKVKHAVSDHIVVEVDDDTDLD